ncbi:hypothetical protein FGIG_05562 [Fasciola gigantica]|uniref:Uncharacterized protein n=1 Tax=Fasciola gigantica TaxID=46835 RepID=A0A504YS70_FASGI|nr:hypothetical protein FGIG_05562 [Fasciola gigantica]
MIPNLPLGTDFPHRIWLLFKQLVDWHTSEDDALSVDFLKGTENPIDCLAQHQSRTPAFWVHLVHGNRLPCGCDLPKPAPLRPQSQLRCFFSNETVVTSNEDRTCTSSVLSARKKAAFDRWHEELHQSNYTWYFLHNGYQILAWRAFACEIIQLGVMDVPVGIQLALATLDETMLMAPQETLPGFRGGQLMWLYMVLLSLSERVATEFTDSSVSRVQHSVLLEYLVSLLESTQEEEIVQCKKRLQTHLENIKASQWSYPESVGHSSSGRAFRLSQLVRQVQKGVLFLTIFGFVETDQSKYCADSEPVMETDTIRHLDWERIGQINFGLTESVIHALRSSATKATTRPNPGSSGTAEASAAHNVAL